MPLIYDTQEKIERFKASLTRMDNINLLEWERSVRSCRTREGAQASADPAALARAGEASFIDLVVQIAVASHPYLQDEINNRGLKIT